LNLIQLDRVADLRRRIAESEAEFTNERLFKITRECIASRIANLRRELARAEALARVQQRRVFA
jgi:hypothetical protein